MIERVARALHRAHYERGRRLYPSGAWEALDRFERENWLFSARAAVATMREATDAMELAAMDAFADPRFENWDKLPAVYRAMIDAALTETATTSAA
jgi:hypothetical protein